MNVKKKVMIVDDDDTMRDLMSELFLDVGYETVTASGGAAALDIMRNDPVWVLFIDLKMPEMDGTEVCEKIREGWPMAIPFAVTGYSSLFELSDCREAGFEDYFMKPVNRRYLLEAAENAFNKLERWMKK
jgi:CheY-like chemotaxis protein